MNECVYSVLYVLPLRLECSVQPAVREQTLEVILNRYTAIVFLLIIAGCRQDNEQSYTGDSAYSPVLVIQFIGTGTSPSLPWDISPGRDDVSASMLFPGVTDVKAESNRLIQEALDNEMLLALVSDSCKNYSVLSSDHIQIWVDSTGNVKALPQELMNEISGSAWLENTTRQDMLLQLFDTYKPDVIMMYYRIIDISTVLQIAEYWTAPDIVSRYTVVLFSVPDNQVYSRGWCVLAGERINGTVPYGLTESGLFATARLLAGLEWENDLPEIIPAFSILEDTEGIWNHK